MTSQEHGFGAVFSNKKVKSYYNTLGDTTKPNAAIAYFLNVCENYSGRINVRADFISGIVLVFIVFIAS